MKVDVSEIKTFKSCKRQWELSSRNKFHMRPIVNAPALTMGTIFHEALAELYLGVSLEKVMEMVQREMSTDSDGALLAMIPGYYKNVLPGDLDRFKVLDVEHHFEIDPRNSDGTLMFPENGSKTKSAITIVGSIDLVALDVFQNKIYGFEHKTCKDFRNGAFLWMDEQPRVYTWALQQYVNEYNLKRLRQWELDRQALLVAGKDDNIPKPEEATLGGIYLNEVKKLLRGFQNQRTLCEYSNEDLDHFMIAFFQTCAQAHQMVETNGYATPQPDYFACKLCAYNTICSTYMYAPLNIDSLKKEFSEEFVERTEDHLDEKLERKGQ